MAAYMMLAWMISNHVFNATGQDVSDVAAARVREQVHASLQADPRFATEDDRRDADHELMRLFVILHAGWQGVQREGPAAVGAYADGVNAMWANTFGQDMRRLDLTDDGFVARASP